MSISVIPLYNRQVLSVDSRSRDEYEAKNALNQWITDPNSYTVHFEPIRNIKQINLISTEIPNTEYVINATNNRLTFNSSAAPAANNLVAVLTPGTYTATELANEVNRQMNVAIGVGFGIGFVATYITWTQKLQIDRVDGLGNFQILWTAALSPRIVMGFDERDMPAMALTVMSDNVVNLSGENFVYLVIRNFPAVRGTESIQHTFAKIIFNTPPHSFTFDSFAANPIVYPEPLNNVNKLEVEFRKHDGSLYDFNRVEHSFTVEFYTTI